MVKKTNTGGNCTKWTAFFGRQQCPPLWVTADKVWYPGCGLSRTAPVRLGGGRWIGACINSVEFSLEAVTPSHVATRLTEPNHAKHRTP